MACMIEAVGVHRVRAAEEPLLAAGVPLMERVAAAIAARAAQVLRGRRGAVRGATVVVLVGPGNNGGDGLHVAARLARRGAGVTVLQLGDRVHEGGLAAARAAGVVVRRAGSGAGADVLGLPGAARLALGADLLVDALVGIGATGALRGDAARFVRQLLGADRRPFVLAVDVPSGIGVGDGTVPGPVLTADLTLACGALAPGLLLPPAAGHAPHVELVDLDLDVPSAQADQERVPAATPDAVHRLQNEDVAGTWPVPGTSDDKYRRGVVGVVAGTATYPGAAVLTVGAAVRSGAGMVRYVGPAEPAAAVLAAHPEVVPGIGRVQAWVLGPGVDPEDGEQVRHVQEALGEAGLGSRGYFAPTGVWGPTADAGIRPVVVDAGALAALPERCAPWVVLTPHAGELARLLGERGETLSREDVEAEPYRWARRACDLTGATVLLKGATTVVVGPGGTFSQAEAPAWLATAGAGDVLAGLLGTLLAARAEEAVQHPALVVRLAALAALVHGRAATMANPGGPVSASMLVEALPRTIANLITREER
jgi:hydroxyethylthiazole kinase-like uncharacterized protein yjeF